MEKLIKLQATDLENSSNGIYYIQPMHIVSIEITGGSPTKKAIITLTTNTKLQFEALNLHALFGEFLKKE